MVENQNIVRVKGFIIELGDVADPASNKPLTNLNSCRPIEIIVINQDDDQEEPSKVAEGTGT